MPLHWYFSMNFLFRKIRIILTSKIDYESQKSAFFDCLIKSVGWYYDPIWSNLIQFHPVSSNLIKFDEVWSSLNQFHPFGSNLMLLDQVWSGLNKFKKFRWCFLVDLKTPKNISKLIDLYQMHGNFTNFCHYLKNGFWEWVVIYFYLCGFLFIF